jgi:S1-C subfamily serine protease
MIGLLLLLLAQSPTDWTTIGHSVPRLEMKRGDDKGACSGVVILIEDGWAYGITAAHCVDRAPTERFDMTANDRHASAVAFNTVLDLAVIKFRAHNEVAITLAPAMPPVGAEIAVIGYAFGVSELVMQFGHVAQPYNRETKSVWCDVVTIFGDSGGAVVDGQGRLIAITSRIYSGGLLGQAAHISAAVPLDALKDFLDDFQQHLKKEKEHK